MTGIKSTRAEGFRSLLIVSLNKKKPLTLIYRGN